MDAPFYVVFAGVNGAGKSTLYQSGLWQLPGMPSTMERVNPDETLREQGGDWRSSSDQLRAGREARKRINELFEKRQSFNQETTLTGRLAARNIKHARQQGYRVLVNYVGVQDAAIALERIAHRVAQGGHDIDESAVRRRFRDSLRAFSCLVGQCERATVFDNTEDFRTLAYWKDGMLGWWGGQNRYTPWLKDAILDEELWRIP